ncbi:lambda-exonuclease family protein [Paenibacillus sp. JMULE4]|uniref:lambda-exonuclease family protein n=1 Tax=Paenibacillus sp. JMULE4 TaxID=2518342 RepID=UPI00157506E8|nr:YqaJ viral recombinase family protein [Paenibacillus sp. JMULE4]
MIATLQANVLVETEGLTHDQWLEYRRKGIGGSDIAGICGLSKWKRPIHVFLEKIGQAPPESQSEAAEWGTLLEPLIADKFARNHPEWAITEKKVIYSHPKYEWALGNLDRMIICPDRGRGILEIKTASEYLKHEWDDGNIPDYYFVQLQWYMFVCGLDWGYFATLIGGNKYREYEVYRDDELIGQLLRLASDLWYNHILPRTPPPFDGSDASTNLLNRLYPDASESSIKLEDVGLIEKYLEKKQQIKDLEEEFSEVENLIKAILGNHEIGICGNYRVKWENRSRTGVDGKLLKERYPDIYQECLKFTKFRQLSIKQEGKFQ